MMEEGNEMMIKWISNGLKTCNAIQRRDWSEKSNEGETQTSMYTRLEINVQQRYIYCETHHPSPTTLISRPRSNKDPNKN